MEEFSSAGPPRERPFDPQALERTLVALPLIEAIKKSTDEQTHNVIIDVHLGYADGSDKALAWIKRTLKKIAPKSKTIDASSEEIDEAKSKYSTQYVYAKLKGSTIRKLAELAIEDARKKDEKTKKKCENGKSKNAPPIYKIWLDFDLEYRTNVSIRTVKVDAAHAAFRAGGDRIVWAVADSGIDGGHPHFETYKNLKVVLPLRHRDFAGKGNRSDEELEESALQDVFGHGTHVAGIIAGVGPKTLQRETDGNPVTVPVLLEAVVRERVNLDDAQTRKITVTGVSGMAPECKLLSLKVLKDDGKGLSSNLIAAIEYIQHLNGNGREIRIHGLNVSVGYTFKPEWFACGESPLCVEIDRLVRSGVSVVVAAGNDGYGFVDSAQKAGLAAGLDVTINDPGNADLAITVGSTHREMPHRYGVSYFSSKGPTGDGRLKPDLLAPGEKIISCASSGQAEPKIDVDDSASAVAEAPANKIVASYREDSGTSMAAPHVSGAIAAFLSIRREFIGRPEAVKEVFLSSATDLRRAVYFQGKGLLDLMRAIQSI